MSSKRPSTLAINLLARPGKAPARTTEIEDLPRNIDAPVEVMDRLASEPVLQLPAAPEEHLPPLPVPELAPAQEFGRAPAEPPARESKPGSETKAEKGIKANTVGTTVYLLPAEATRIKHLALDLRISLHDLILDGLDSVLAKHGKTAITRYSPPKGKK